MLKNLEKEFTSEGEGVKETTVSKCENCGANMLFDPLSQHLKCPHCGSLKDFEKSSAVSELYIEEAFRQVENWDKESSVYRCENCGAVVVLSPHEVATSCPYCKTSHVVKSEELAGLRPNAVYPYSITKEMAVDNAKKWVKKKFFTPKAFKKNLKTENIQGVYEPAFTFDSCTYSTYKGRIGKRHTRVVGSGKNRRTQTYISWRTISGSYALNFDDVFINATKSYSQSLLTKIMPFDYSAIKEYSKDYLTGFMAKRHEKNIDDAWVDAKAEMDNRLKKAILSQYSYDVVDYLNVETTHEKVTYKYVLLPIYHLNFIHRKKTYCVYVNGQTGKVAGKTPISLLKVLLVALFGLAVAISIIALYLKSENII